MNLRKDHYRVERGGASRPAALPHHPCLPLKRCFGGPAARPPGGSPSLASARRRPLERLPEGLPSERLQTVTNKTFNNGSLGSGIDEERSEMR